MGNKEGGKMIRVVNVRDDEPGSLIDDESVSDEEKLAFFDSLEKTQIQKPVTGDTPVKK